jgi:hypothetical protein
MTLEFGPICFMTEILSWGANFGPPNSGDHMGALFLPQNNNNGCVRLTFL